jgi:hypothetical protein
MEEKGVRKVDVTVEGIRDYIQHRRPASFEEEKKTNAAIEIVKRNKWDEKAAKVLAEIAAYRNAKTNKLYIPFTHFHEAMAKAAVNYQVGGKGKKTYKDHVKSYIFFEPEEIPLTPQRYEIDKSFVRIHGQGVLVYRPRFSNWGANFTLLVTDEAFPLDILKGILSTAGLRVGIGDHRPQFGLFKVTKFEGERT